MGSVNEMTVHLQVANTFGYGCADGNNDLIEKYRSVGRLLTRLAEKWR
jgi:hypothetical protein